MHHADPTLVLLKRRDLLRVGRPHHDGPVRVLPTGIVRGVAEALDAVPGELRLLPARDVLCPEIEILDEHRALAIGRANFWTRTAGSPATPSCRRRRGCLAIIH